MKTKQWINRHINDFYVKESKRLNYKSRAAFKLIEINKKFNILKNGKKIIDLGSAPGGWLQVIKENCKASEIIGIDLLKIDSIPGIHLIEGDFLNFDIQNKISNILKDSKVDIITSDIAPSITGNKDLDRAKIREIADHIIDFAKNNISYQGHLVFKYFRYDESELIKILKCHFKEVKIFKPKVSRSESSEIFIVSKGFIK